MVKPWVDDSSSWRIAMNGLNLEGYCKNSSCEAHNEGRVIIEWGYNDFNFFHEQQKSRCPLCNDYVAPISYGLTNTFWKYTGLKKVGGRPPEKISCDWQFATDDGYTTFEDEKLELVSWLDLTIQVKRPKRSEKIFGFI
ncbi:hypothetical protein C1645_359127 [Glomus cerebriforme]|uniref:Uncharacterized protein n=1 Tax=Glomus cerebriforme TaxID=658196 RepID=A0A397SSJ4_9GLOM|nr:hypothetical protein C1645_359127 [Glomus cerebriforme]